MENNLDRIFILTAKHMDISELIPTSANGFIQEIIAYAPLDKSNGA